MGYVQAALALYAMFQGIKGARQNSKIQQQNLLSAYNSALGQYNTQQEQVGQQYNQAQKSLVDQFEREMSSVNTQFSSAGLSGNSEFRVENTLAQKANRSLDVLGLNRSNQMQQMFLEMDAKRQQTDNGIMAARVAYQGQRDSIIAGTAAKLVGQAIDSQMPAQTDAAKQAGIDAAKPNQLLTVGGTTQNVVSPKLDIYNSSVNQYYDNPFQSFMISK